MATADSGQPIADASLPDDTEPDASTDLAPSELFHLLQSDRRREAVRRLREIDGETSLGTLAEEIAAAEAGVAVEQLSSDQRRRVYISLYQSHLPKLAEASLIEYDPDRGTVRPRDALGVFDPYLDPDESIDAVDSGTSRLVSGVTVGIGLLVAAGATGTSLPAVWWALVGATALVCCGFVFRLQQSTGE